MPRPAWYRGMTGCLQTIPRDEQDVDVEAGDLEVGELRPRPFQELARALTPKQRTALTAIAIADLAVWPELDATVARTIAATLEGAALPTEAPRSHAVADRAALALLTRVIPGLHAARDARELQVAWEELRRAVHSVLRTHPRRFAATEQWLRRVVPLSTILTPDEAKRTAVRALAHRLGGAAPFIFATTRYDAREGLEVAMISARPPTTPLGRVAKFTRYVVTDRVLHVGIEPLVPLDPYRVQYLFRSLFLDDATGDAELGGYDQAICTDSTGVVASLPSL